MSDTDGKVNWFEIPAGNTDRARSFYGGLFGWTFSRSTTPAATSDDRQRGHLPVREERRHGLLRHVRHRRLDREDQELGGSSDDAQDIPNVGRYATCTDTEGNAFGLFERTSLTG